MRFAIALLATSVSALELPSTFYLPTGTTSLDNNATNWQNYVKSASNDISYTTSKFNNRFAGKGMYPHSTGLAKINDVRGFVPGLTGTVPNANTAANMNWFGGCYLKPSKIMEEYFNDPVAGKRFQVWGTTTQTVADKLPQFSNRKLSGYATYRCYDTAPGTDTSTVQSCELGAKATGYYFDQNQGQATTKLELWRPNINAATSADSGAATVVASDVHRYLDDNCIPIKDYDNQTTPALVTPGTFIDLFQNMYVQTTTAGQKEFSNEHFLATLGSPGNLQNAAMSDLGTTRNNQLIDASVRLNWYFPGGTTPYTIVNTGANGHATHAAAMQDPLIGAQFAGLNETPPIGCCAFEEWNKRTFMRTASKLAREYERNCEATRTYDFVNETWATATPRSGIPSCFVGAATAGHLI